MTTPRRAFYALEPGGWRDYVTLLHLPYTAWHLAYVAIGAALSPVWLPGRLGLSLAAFGLAVGVGAHALDELVGRPLRTRIPSTVLIALAAASIGGAVAIGVAVALRSSLWLLAFVAIGGVLVVAYNLELAGGLFHSDLWFAASWGALPVLAAYFAAAEHIRLEAVLAAGAAAALSGAQRRLSTEARALRRNGPVDAALATRLAAAPEAALLLLAGGTCLLAAALCAARAG